MKKNLKTYSGITLIALIITIIVMLILVAVTVSTVINSGLFGHAQGAVNATAKKDLEFQNDLNQLNIELNILNPESEDSIIPIYTSEQLMKIGSDETLIIEEDGNKGYKFASTSSYKLQNSIDISGIEWEPLPAFSGTLDGNNYSIIGLTKNDASLYDFGFFQSLQGAVVKNLAFVDINITAARNIGSIASYMTNSTIENCFVTGSMNTLAYSGGIVSCVGPNSIIRNCYTTCSITATTTGGLWASIGGIAGWSAWNNGGGIIENCYSTSIITADNPYIGSIIGYDEDTEIRNCYALSSSISGSYIWRVIGAFKSGTNNYAYNAMLINEETRSSTDATSTDGCDITLEEATSQSHYQTNGTWQFDSNGPWTFEYTNVAEGTNLPVLKSFTSVTQSPKI